MFLMDYAYRLGPIYDCIRDKFMFIKSYIAIVLFNNAYELQLTYETVKGNVKCQEGTWSNCIRYF